MEKERIKNKSWLIVIGSLLFLSGVGLISFDYYLNKMIKDSEQVAIEEFYEEEELIQEEIIEEIPKEEVSHKKEAINYIAVLKIPKIKLERGLVDPDSYLNNVKYNIEILDESTMPDVESGNVILAAHSGNARVSYFRNLDKLELGDEAIIIYNSVTYKYKIVDKYLIEKTGTAEIIKNKGKSTLTLITCKHNTKKQIVVIAELQ